MKVNIPIDRTSAQPLESGRAIETGQPRDEEGCNTNLVTTPLLRNNPLGVKSLSKTVNSSSILDNSVIIGELLEDDNSGKDSNVIDEELRRVGRDVEAAEFQNNTKPCEVLSEAHETLPISHASHVVPRFHHLIKIDVSYQGGHEETKVLPMSVKARGNLSQVRKETWRNPKKILGCLLNAFMLHRLMDRKIIYWWRLIVSPASNNELPSVELSRAWEPAYRKRAHGTCTGKRSFCCVFIRDTNR